MGGGTAQNKTGLDFNLIGLNYTEHRMTGLDFTVLDSSGLDRNGMD